MSYSLKVGSRRSLLAQAQVAEVLREIRYFDPTIDFETIFLETCGDKDLTTSLRTLGKSNFFTKEIDEALLNGDVRLAIHSAKDLPEKLPPGLYVAAITAGQDPRDTIVGKIFPGARVGISSERREEMVREIEPTIKAVDVRGTIETRLALLDTGALDALVVPEAALKRLGIDRPRRFLPGETAPLQGQLAIVVRADDVKMKELFAALDTRKKTLYFGLDPTNHPKGKFVTHYPLIETHFWPISYPDLSSFTVLVATSQRAVEALLLAGHNLSHFTALAVGPRTAASLEAAGVRTVIISKSFQAEGVTELLPQFKSEKIFYPHSARSRPIIKNYLVREMFDFCAMAVYDTLYTKLEPSISLEAFDELFFTSPSTVEAFIKLYKKLPQDKMLRTIGPITKEALLCHINSLT